MRILILILFISTISGCATPSLQGKISEDGRTATISPTEEKDERFVLLKLLFPRNLPKGDYYIKKGDTEFKADIKTDMRLFSFDMNAMKDED